MAKNTLKNNSTEDEETPTPTTKKNVKSKSAKSSSGFWAFMQDPRVKKISGVFLLLFGCFLFLACLSYLFTGSHDQYLITGNTNVADFSDHEPYSNWMGKMGAHIAHFFMFTYLGVGAFFLSFIVFLWGIKVALNKEPLPFYKSLRLSILGALYFPLAIGFFFHHRVDGFDRKIEISCNDRFVGGYGHFATEWTTFTLGWFGTLMLLLFVLGAYLIFNHNHKVESWWESFSEWMKRPKDEKPEEPEVEEIVEEEEEIEEEDENEVQEEEDFFKAEKKTVITPITNSLRTDRPAPIMQDISKDDPDEEGPEPFLITREPAAPVNHVEEISFEIKKVTPTPEVAQTPIVVEPEAGIELDINPIIPAAAETPALLFKPAPEPINDFEIELPPVDPQSVAKPNFELNAPVSEMEVEIPKVEEELSDDELGNKLQEFGPYDPKLDLSRYEPPSIELLKNHGSGVPQINKEELEANKNKIVETLNHYKIEIDKIKATVGPTVTLYEIVPAPGVRISKIKNLEDDIALSLAALGIRIIAPIPGKGTIGIEVPNSRPDIVSMRSLIASEKFQNNDMELPVVLGKTISNENFVADLAKMPHLLMAGATGQGKSVGLNAILVSLLYKKHPSQIKFVLVDPKKVELTLFNKIERHFLAKLPDTDEAIITDTSKVVRTLNSLCIEMDERYELLKTAQCRNIKEYNAKFISRRLNPENGHRYLPYIVLVVDEFADLIMTAGREVETPIARLAQLARAIGIHLIIATQRPSVNIITGTIKANFPARIAFRVTSKIDSRTILDAGGADQLIGRGDMLFSTGNDLIRIQCGFVDTPEVEEITDFIGSQQGYPNALLLPEVPDESGNTELSFSEEDRDSLFEEAAKMVVMTQQGSASLLQRKLKLGYNRAGRLVDQLEAAGIIGPFEGSKARKVLIQDEISLQHHLDSMK